MRRCAVCGKVTKARKCPADSFPTLRVVSGSGQEIAPGSKIGERYEVTELIGQGGFGKVFGVKDLQTGTAMAVKVLSPAFNAESEEATRRFVREANTTSKLTHGNTIRVFDYGQTQNAQLFLVMERLYGEPLSARLNSFRITGRPMPAAEIIRIGCGVLASLSEAHKLGLVHRDMKPENVFLHQLGKRDIVKVLDFGIVREKNSQMTQVGQPIGTPTHMSPEQAMGKDEIDARSDLYSLGVCMYELASLRLPIDRGANSLMTMMAHVTQETYPLAETAPELPPDLAAVIERALAKSPDDRYATANDMRNALLACKDAKSRRRTSQLTVSVEADRKKLGKRNKDSHRLLQERRISRLSLQRLPDDVQSKPPPMAPAGPPPVRAVQARKAAVSGSNSRAKNLHLATTQTLKKEAVEKQIRAAEAKKKRSE